MNTLFLWACSFTRLSFCTLFLYERQKLLCLHVHMTLQPCYAIESTFKAINWISPYWWHSKSSQHNMGGVAQMVERSLSMREVPGSIPGASKSFSHLCACLPNSTNRLSIKFQLEKAKCQNSLHRPGIEPGPPAWQASILPLNQRCFIKKVINIYV